MSKSEPIEEWWSPYGSRYSLEDIEAHGMVPTDQIEEFEYAAPYPTDGPVPCDDCRGQGAKIWKYRETDSNYVVSHCYTCHGTTELEFLCSGCGAQEMVKNARLTKDLPEDIIQHLQWCPINDRCMTMISQGARTCCRPIVARFDIQADGKMWGFCGVHSRGKQDDEERAAKWAFQKLESDWADEVSEAKEATVDDRIAAIKQKLGMAESAQLDHRTGYDGKTRVTISLEMLESYVGVPTPAAEQDLVSLVGFEAGDGPEPF